MAVLLFEAFAFDVTTFLDTLKQVLEAFFSIKLVPIIKSEFYWFGLPLVNKISYRQITV